MPSPPDDAVFPELAFLYLLMAYGADGRLDEAEVDAVTEHLHARYPDIGTAEARTAVADALAAYVKTDAPHERAREAWTLLGQRLPEPGLRLLHRDLYHVAEADGIVTDAERALLHRLAEVWDLDDAER